MDTRYSPEQLELRAATAALASDLGPHTVADLDDRARQAKLSAAGTDALDEEALARLVTRDSMVGVGVAGAVPTPREGAK